MILALLALLFVLLVPGYLLVAVLFPRRGELDREYDIVYRLGLGVVLSIAVLVILGLVLNGITAVAGPDPATGQGLVVAPNLWAGTLLLCGLFLLLGWWRGAHPWMVRLHPALARVPPRDPHALLDDLESDRRTVLRFRTLAEERDRLRGEIKRVDRKMEGVGADLRERYRRRRASLQERLRGVDREIRQLEEARARELY